MQNHPIKIALLTYISLIHSTDILKDGCISNSDSYGNLTQMFSFYRPQGLVPALSMQL